MVGVIIIVWGQFLFLKPVAVGVIIFVRGLFLDDGEGKILFGVNSWFNVKPQIWGC